MCLATQLGQYLILYTNTCLSGFSAGPIPLRVREAEVPIVSENECVRKINAVTEKIFILPASSFCAGGESGHDACQVGVYTEVTEIVLLKQFS